jgi:CheY-like chemotaxis protein
VARTPQVSRPVILLVQPERDDREMYVEFMESEGLRPVCVATAADALPLVPGADVVVTGILLPGQMDGLEFVARLRRNDQTRRLPIVVLTTAAWDSERTRAERAGCDLFLPKPCLPADLVHELRRLLAARSGGVRQHATKSRPHGRRAKPVRHRSK